jgi:hypothetical protein
MYFSFSAFLILDRPTVGPILLDLIFRFLIFHIHSMYFSSSAFLILDRPTVGPVLLDLIFLFLGFHIRCISHFLLF